MNNEEPLKYLQWLSVFHYIVGGIGVLFACFPLIHVGVGLSMLFGAFPELASGNSPPMWFGLLFVVLGGLFFLAAQALAWLIIYSGVQLRKQQKYMLSFIVAGIMCIFFPIGTVLGVLTIIVLSKEPVKNLYEKTF